MSDRIQTPWGNRDARGNKSAGDAALERLGPFDKAKAIAAKKAAVTPNVAPPTKRFASDLRDSRGNTVPTASGGTALDTQTVEARQRMLDAKARAKGAQQNQGALNVANPEHSATIVALLNSFQEMYVEPEGLFVVTPYNALVFWRCLVQFTQEGRGDWTIETMLHIAAWLKAERYFEDAEPQREGPAPRLFPPDFGKVHQPTEADAHPFYQEPVKVVPVDTNAEANARAMPMGELRKKVRAGYKRETNWEFNG